jgi:hypothetical protein
MRRQRLTNLISYEDFCKEVFSYVAFTTWSHYYSRIITSDQTHNERRNGWIDSRKMLSWIYPYHNGEASMNQVKRLLDKMADDGLLERRRWGRPTPFCIRQVAIDSPACQEVIEDTNHRTRVVADNVDLRYEAVAGRARPRKMQIPYHVRQSARNTQAVRRDRPRNGRREEIEAVYRVR